MKKTLTFMIAAAFVGMAAQPAMADDASAEKIYSKKCKMCHKLDGKKMGPGFKQMNTDPAVLKETIMNGRKVMPKFAGKYSEAEIDALVAFIQEQQKD